MNTFSGKRNERGIILITVYLVVAVLLILGTAFLIRVVHEASISERDRHAAEALYIAEGAYQQVLFDLQKDFTSSFDWFDGNINGMNITPNTFSWVTVPYTPTTMGDGTFLAELQGVVGNPAALKIRATGTSSGITRRILVNADIVDLSLWNNVIFGGVGQGGNVINGNVDVRGSVHILGTGLNPSDLAMDLSGSGNVGNNYNGMPAALSSRLPSLPIVDFNGELVQSLGAEVRIKRGLLGLSGTGIAGSPNVSGNAVKETLNGVYITNGYGGNKGAANVSSDNGTGNGYDAGSAVSFKTFSNPYTYNGVTYPTYSNFVQTKGMDLAATVPGWNNKIDSTTGSFGPYTDGNGNSIQWTQSTGILEVTNLVYDPNSSLDIGKKNTTVLYEGKGTIVALGSSSDIKVHGDLLSNGTFATTDAMAFIAEDSIEIATGGGESQIKVTGVFYGQNSIQMDKQSQLAGTFVSDYFGMDQTPSIYQVPSFDARNHPGLIGRDPIFFMRVSSWQEIQ